MTKKIIHIYHRAYDSFFPSSDCLYYYLAGWSSLLARQTLSYTNEYAIENWRLESDVNSVVEKDVEGIRCKLFPMSSAKCHTVFPTTLLLQLYEETRNRPVLINLHQIHNVGSYVIIYLFQNIPIVVHHHGDFPASCKNTNSLYKKGISSARLVLERKVFGYVDYFSVISKVEKTYLEGIVDPGKVVLEQGRVFFDEWKPINKQKARDNLRISAGKKVIMYVGKYYKLKGVDIIIKVYKHLRKKYDLELILVGGSPTDPLYNVVNAAGVRNYGHVSHDRLLLFYSAADVYLLPAFDNKLVSFGGLGTSVIEALACNVPVVTKQLIHFPAGEWEKVGRIPKDESDVQTCISDIFDNPEVYQQCREVARKYYDLHTIISHTIEVYARLFSEYYGR